jgi:hypothetical protein
MDKHHESAKSTVAATLASFVLRQRLLDTYEKLLVDNAISSL